MQKILRRLQNLEAIVTSETWEFVKSGEDAGNISLTLEEEKPEELEDADKADKIAKRMR